MAYKSNKKIYFNGKEQEQMIIIDNTDFKIIKLISQNPNINQSDISKELNLSQPSVCLRVKKLYDLKVIEKEIKINSYILQESE